MTLTAQRARSAQPAAPAPVSLVHPDRSALPVLDVTTARIIMGRWRSPDRHTLSRTLQAALGQTPTGVFDTDSRHAAVMWQSRHPELRSWSEPRGVLTADELAQLGSESGLWTVEDA